MNPTPLTLDLSALPSTPNPTRGPQAPVLARRPSPSRTPRSGPSRSIELSQAWAREIQVEARTETAILLLVAGCALSALAAATLDLDRAMSQWPAFEAFVRALLG